MRPTTDRVAARKRCDRERDEVWLERREDADAQFAGEPARLLDENHASLLDDAAAQVGRLDRVRWAVEQDRANADRSIQLRASVPEGGAIWDVVRGMV